MRGFIYDARHAHETHPIDAPRNSWLRASDLLGRHHVLRLDEAPMHHRSLACPCRPKVRSLVICHRRIRNSRSLYRPWELGH